MWKFYTYILAYIVQYHIMGDFQMVSFAKISKSSVIFENRAIWKLFVIYTVHDCSIRVTQYPTQALTINWLLC